MIQNSNENSIATNLFDGSEIPKCEPSSQQTTAHLSALKSTLMEINSGSYHCWLSQHEDRWEELEFFDDSLAAKNRVDVTLIYWHFACDEKTVA